MLCQHLSIMNPRYGAESTCANCQLPIMFDGERWRWLYDIDSSKARRMRTAWRIDRLTGKHS